MCHRTQEGVSNVVITEKKGKQIIYTSGIYRISLP